VAVCVCMACTHHGHELIPVDRREEVMLLDLVRLGLGSELGLGSGLGLGFKVVLLTSAAPLPPHARRLATSLASSARETSLASAWMYDGSWGSCKGIKRSVGWCMGVLMGS
jgi:hypothetical protein